MTIVSHVQSFAKHSPESLLPPSRRLAQNWKRYQTPATQDLSEQSPPLGHTPETVDNVSESHEQLGTKEDGWPAASLVPGRLLFWSAAGFLAIYCIVVMGSFKYFVTPLATTALIPFASFISMRSFGETNNGAVVAIGTL